MAPNPGTRPYGAAAAGLQGCHRGDDRRPGELEVLLLLHVYLSWSAMTSEIG